MAASQVPTILQIHSSVSEDWNAHRDFWNECTGCELCNFATHKVLARGSLPCSYLFIGEAPGEQEDILARPFVGRAGSILQALIDQLQTVRKFSYAITNIVACKPFGAGEEIAAPSKESADACHGRLTQLISIAKPRRIIFLGKEAEKRRQKILKDTHIKPDQTLAVWHPSYINRKGGLNSLEFKRTLLALKRFLVRP